MDQNKQKRRGRWWLLLIVLVCASPLIGSYLTYYVIKPSGRTNYGTLIDPRNYPIPALDSTRLDGTPASLNDYKGKWLLVQVDGSACAQACRDKLFAMRQLRLMQGKEMERVERVWLITDRQPLETILIREYDGTRMLRVDPAKLKAWLPVEAGGAPEDHFFLIDPLGNLMMRFPKNPEPGKVKKDMTRLLMASGIG